MNSASRKTAAILAAPDCLALVQEYCQLAVQPTLSEADADRLEALLHLAETDGRLDFWFHEVDHFLDHALGLGSATQIYASVNENLKARLRELLDIQAGNEATQELIEDLQDSLGRGGDLDASPQPSRP